MSLNVYLENDGCPHCGRTEEGFDANITHNLTKMADEAGIYGVVWRPSENGITLAGDLIEPLRKAIANIKSDPERFQQHNPKNKWGTYEDFVPWLEEYLAACERMPDASVRASR